MGRLRLGTISLTFAVLAAVGVTAGAAQATTTGMEFGARVATRAGETAQAAVLRMETATGRPLNVVREFLNWDSTFPDTFHTWLKNTDHTVILSVKSKRRNGTIVRWADIVAAQPGSTLYADVERWADRIKAYGVPINFAFNHEPESSASKANGEAVAVMGAAALVAATLSPAVATGAAPADPSEVAASASHSYGLASAAEQIGDLWRDRAVRAAALSSRPTRMATSRRGARSAK